MRKASPLRLAAVAALAIGAGQALVAPAAEAGLRLDNGVGLNGVSMNGANLNGVSPNGLRVNGTSFNGAGGRAVPAAPSAAGALRLRAVRLAGER